ncbi:armadillo-type protein [Gaertneriomyces semiglobifer]|nr:armadillo-type protein [Gaertneriomyces semiglobifer]
MAATGESNTDTSEDFSTSEQLQKIRAQTNSGLENQRQCAIILTAVEETIKEQHEALTPLAYFGALMTILDQQKEGGEESIVAAAMHLLGVVAPRIPVAVLRVKFTDISDTLVPLLENFQENQALVRNVLGCLEVLLVAQDTARWTTDMACKKLYQALLIMSVDGRPKVRRRAHEVVRRVLSRPPPPSAHHPATSTTIEFALKALNEYSETVANASAKDRKELEQQILHVLVFLKAALPVLAVQGAHDRTRNKLRALCELLLRLPVRSSGSGNTVLTQWIFQVLDALFGAGAAEDGIFAHLDLALLDSVIRSLLEIRPYQNDATLIPAWLDLIGRGFSRLAELVRKAEVDAEEALASEREYAVNEYPKLLTSVFESSFVGIFSQATTKPVITAKAAAVLAAMMRDCISVSMVQRVDQDAYLLQIINTINTGLTDIKYRAAWGAVLNVAEQLFDRLGPAMPELIRATLVHIMAFRDDQAYGESFPFKDELEIALHAAVQSLGLTTFTEYVPLNIENERPGEPRRPYLLSTFVQAFNRPLPSTIGQPENVFGPHTLEYLAKVLLPLANRVMEKSGSSNLGGRQVEAKLFETLGTQIWAMVPGICSTLPRDVGYMFKMVVPYFGRILQTSPEEVYPNLLTHPDFRPAVCDALESLIDGYRSVVKQSEKDEDSEGNGVVNPEDARLAEAGLQTLQSNATTFLSVLCNNYTTVDPSILGQKAKGQALQGLHERENQHYERTIKSLLSVADETAVVNYFMNLVSTLLQSQSEEQEADGDVAAAQLGRLRDYAMLDLLLILLPFLPDAKDPFIINAESPLLLFFKVLTGQLRDADSTLQKRTYKCLNHVVALIPSEHLNLQELIDRLVDPAVLANSSSGSKKARIQLIQLVAEAIPVKDKTMLLGFVPVALSEVMLATKEASEKARNAAYDCLVAMGHKMHRGGVQQDVDGTFNLASLSKSLMSNEDEEMDYAQEAEVSLREYFMMVIAGLAGETSTMQSAAIASLSRLLFEFAGVLDAELCKELVSTVMYVMASRNREVVKAALGFIKVAIVMLKQEVLEDELENIIVSILNHSRDHKSHFRAKVRHIFERLVRKFSFEAVEGFVPETDKKLMNNIRKRRERLKKRKLAAKQNADAESDDELETSKRALAGRGTQTSEAVRKQFEDALYGSESELDDDSDEDGIPEQFREALRPRLTKADKANAAANTMIRESDDVADFLDSRIVGAVTGVQRRLKKKGSDFKNSEDGRMVIDSDSEAEDNGEAQMTDANQVPEDHYKASLNSDVAFTRTADGRVRFLTPAQKRKREEDEETAETKGSTGLGLGWGQKKRDAREVGLKKNEVEKMLGRQFKAKRAKGDVKKTGGPDPYAYIPLTSKVVGGQK